MNTKGLPGSDIASLRWPVISPATPLVYSATTSPKLSRWMATFCPASTLSLSLTRCSTRPPAVARIGYALLPTKTITSLPVRPIWPGNDAVMLENVHCAFHEERDHLRVQDARSADFRREGRDAHVHKRVVQDTGIYMIVEDLADGIELHHRLDLGHIHAADIECGDFEAGCPCVEVDCEVGVRPQQPIEQKPSVSAGCGGTVLVPGPLPIHIDQIDASAVVGPSALHAFQGRAGHVRDRHHRARHPRRVELAHHGLDRMHRTHLVAMHATGQDAALARRYSLGDRHRHIPVLSGWHLDALKIQKVLLAGFQIVDVERADDLLSVYRVSGKDGSS